MATEGNSKVIFAIIVILAILGIFYLSIQPHKSTTPVAATKNTTTKNTTQQANQSKQNVTTFPSNTQTPTPLPLPNKPSNNSTNTSKSQQPNCFSNRSSFFVYNGNFSTGTYEDWQLSGSGFGSAPTNMTSANNNYDYYQHPWSNYNYPYAATTYHQGRILTPGNISTNFVVVEPYLNFQITSPQNSNLYVEILYNNNPVIVNHYDTLTAQGTNTLGTFADASINMTSLDCKSVTLRVVSNVLSVTSSNQNQFIAVTGFVQSASPSSTSGVTVT